MLAACRAVRRLVAQRLRAGREDHEPAAPVRACAAGVAAIQCGAMLMALACQNRAGRRSPGISGACICSAPDSSCCWSRRWRPNTRSAGTCITSHFYQVRHRGVPVFSCECGARVDRALAGDHDRGGLHGVTIFMMVLTLFAAQPLLGPIYVQVDRFMPPDFRCSGRPGAALDLVLRRHGARERNGCRPRLPRWCSSPRSSPCGGRSPIPDVAGGPQRVHRQRPDAVQRRPGISGSVVRTESSRTTSAAASTIALSVGFVSPRCGLWWGNWMARVQR